MTWEVPWARVTIAIPGAERLIASGLDFSDGEKGMGKAGGLCEYCVKILFSHL